MNTIVTTIPKEEFAELKNGNKNFILMRSRVELKPGQRVILQEEMSFENELDLGIAQAITDVPGLMKSWYLIGFKPQSVIPVDLTDVDFGQAPTPVSGWISMETENSTASEAVPLTVIIDNIDDVLN